MRINDRLIKLAYQRKALINKVENVLDDMRNIPQTKHVKADFSTVKISDLSAEEQVQIIRFTHKER